MYNIYPNYIIFMYLLRRMTHTHTHEFHLAKWRHWPSATASPMFHSYPGRLLLQCEDCEVMISNTILPLPVWLLEENSYCMFLHVFAIPCWAGSCRVWGTDHHLPCHHRHLGTLVVTGSGQKRYPDSVLTSSLPAGMPVLFTPVHRFFKTCFHRHVSALYFCDSLASVEANRQHVEYQLGLLWNHCWYRVPFHIYESTHFMPVPVSNSSVQSLLKFWRNHLKHFLLMMKWQQTKFTNGRIRTSQTAERFLAFNWCWGCTNFQTDLWQYRLVAMFILLRRLFLETFSLWGRPWIWRPWVKWLKSLLSLCWFQHGIVE